MDKLSITTKNLWEKAHSRKALQLKYPGEHVVRFIFTQFPTEISKRKQLKILDLGCGSGANTVFFAKEGFEVYATDIADEGLKATQERLKKAKVKAKLKNASMDSQPFKDNFFDGVISFGVFYYNTGEVYQRAVDELYRILKKGGKAFVFTRTTDDYRFGKGKKIGKNTFVLNTKDTNENGMINYFLEKEDINIIFKKFSKVVVEKTETTFANLKKKNSDWIIKLVK